jgi:hypothetical protein
MPTFDYQAEDPRGNVISGVLEAADDVAAKAALTAKGYYPRSLRLQSAPVLVPFTPVNAPVLDTVTEGRTGGREAPPSNTLPPANGIIGSERHTASPSVAPFLESVPLPDMAVMYRQLATLLQAGVPMVQSMSTLAEQTRNGRLAGILREMATSIGQGSPISETMVKYPSVFPQMHYEMIKAAETTGMLDSMCNRLSAYIEREVEIRRKIQRETLYPKIVLSVAGCVILLLTFLKAGQDGAIALVIWGMTVAGIGFGLWWLWRYADQYPAIGAMFDNIRLLIPGTGGVARRYATARFTRALGVLYGSGILLTNAVLISARACGNRAIEETMTRRAPELNEGKPLSEFLASSGLLSPSAVQMARTGEQTGSLDIMMDKVSDYLESEADAKAHQLATFLGVAALIIAGIVVFIIAISFYGGMMAGATSAAGG